MKLQVLSLLASIIMLAPASYALENSFYVLHSRNAHELNNNVEVINKHSQEIQLLILQSYHINSTGEVSGYINQALLDAARKHDIKIMFMITNAGYDSLKVHQLLSSSIAQSNAIKSIVEICKHDHLYGVQFDFEMVSLSDKIALTQFYKNAASQLHQAGFKVSYAIIPAFAEHMHDSIFLKKTYQNMSGAYSLKALGQSSDFVTIMAYNQHPDGTIPGPNASIRYATAAVWQVLKEIPAKKVSLGIPTYSLYWYSGYHAIPAHQAEISYQEAMTLIRKNVANLVWDKNDQVNYAVYEHNWLNQYIYLEDAQSFKAKLALAKKLHLRGISIFRIGTEDSRIWSLLKNSCNRHIRYRGNDNLIDNA